MKKSFYQTQDSLKLGAWKKWYVPNFFESRLVFRGWRILWARRAWNISFPNGFMHLALAHRLCNSPNQCHETSGRSEAEAVSWLGLHENYLGSQAPDSFLITNRWCSKRRKGAQGHAVWPLASCQVGPHVDYLLVVMKNNPLELRPDLTWGSSRLPASQRKLTHQMNLARSWP